MNIVHKFLGIIAGGVGVMSLLAFHLAPNYVKAQGYLLHADSIFQKVPLWVPTAGILLISLGLLWGLWKYVTAHFDVAMFRFGMVAAFIVSFSGIYMVTTTSLQRYLLLVVLGATLYFLYGTVHVHEEFITHKMKSYRRMAMMIWTSIAFASSTTMYAVHIFFETIPYFILAGLLAAILTWIMYNIVILYVTLSWRKEWFWFLLMSLFLVETIWIIQLLPFAYITLGFFVTWVWYILQLLFRFHFSKSGIEWKKQQVFLLTNVALFAMVLALLKWQ